MCGIEHHKTRELVRGACRDHFAPETALGEQRYATAMVEMRVCKQKVIDCRRIETECLRVLLVQFPAALKQAAIDQQFCVARFQQMARSGHVVIRAMKRKFHLSVSFSGGPRSGRPAAEYQSRMPRQISSAVSAYQNSSRSSGSIVPSSTRKSGLKTLRQ